MDTHKSFNDFTDFNFANNEVLQLYADNENLNKMINATKAWFTVIAWLDPNKKNIGDNIEAPLEVNDSLEILRHTSLAKRLLEWYLAAVCRHFSETFDMKLKQWREAWAKLQENTAPNSGILENWVSKSYEEIIHDIYSHFERCENSLFLIHASVDFLHHFRIQYHTNLYSLLSGDSKPFSAVPSLFKDMSKVLFRAHFQKFNNIMELYQLENGQSIFQKVKHPVEKFESDLFAWKTLDNISVIFSRQENDSFNSENNNSVAMDLDDIDVLSEKIDISQNNIEPSLVEDLNREISAFSKLYNEMVALDLIHRTKDTLEETLCEQIELRILNTCKGTFNKPMLRSSSNWLYSVVYYWLRVVLSSDLQTSTDSIEDELVTWSKRLNYHFCMMFCDLRISELFDVIVDFPESKPAINDLIICMRRLDTDYRHRLVQSLYSAFKRRLLIPGAGTNDIINTYISTVKCLRLLDPSGVLLEKITGPIRNYLRTREDAARFLVNSWMDDECNNELVEELGHTENPIEDHDDYGVSDDNWVPDPMDAGPDYKSSMYRLADITNLLVSLFDTTDVITEEIQNQMASCLLSKLDYDTGREQTKLELFKLRFGEAKMAPTEVMIKDIADSKRIDTNIYNEISISKAVGLENVKEAVLHGSIISKLFWPTLKNEDFVVPKPISENMQKYENAFQILKPRRELQWLSSLGKVHVELELQDRVLEFEVAPIYAAIIYHFQEQDTWDLRSLAEKMNIDPSKLRGKMGFWEDRGVLRLIADDKWIVLEISVGI
ncbi:anaphase-promoting complex subunit 2-like [Gigaspora margarita]|uniref:Anaphase-promoting complex subunit 2-like n=1 Tax=Gigaspora margarita TaxID=4874 RepID=A0A8H4A4W0_GIGMA|nr:anaphase-promoting complex subunit 2-like [Gigaspora margarita]